MIWWFPNETTNAFTSKVHCNVRWGICPAEIRTCWAFACLKSTFLPVSRDWISLFSCNFSAKVMLEKYFSERNMKQLNRMMMRNQWLKLPVILGEWSLCWPLKHSDDFLVGKRGLEIAYAVIAWWQNTKEILCNSI